MAVVRYATKLHNYYRDKITELVPIYLPVAMRLVDQYKFTGEVDTVLFTFRLVDDENIDNVNPLLKIIKKDFQRNRCK